ncbi:MAG TPA: ATP-binding protein [Candidatus Ozemobacteraceae bacterium]|nr:ATP-binding protein [Candidatus Ozemobacteraceae bacterium]
MSETIVHPERQDSLASQQKGAQDERCADKVALFAGGVAHHLNNILTGIYGGLSLASSSLGQPELLARYLDSVQKAAAKAQELTTQLALLARRDRPVLRPVPPERYLPETVTQAVEGVAGVRLGFRIDAGLPSIGIDMVQFQQALRHLVRNALQAMPHGGSLDISAGFVRSPDSAWGTLDEASRHGWVEICLQDSGTGIPRELIERVFEPHVSTRTHGTGLGLPVCRAIIHRHGGRIRIESAPETGTLVRILVPACSADTGCLPMTSGAVIGNVLVVFGDVIRGDMLTDRLVRLGLNVVKVRTGEEALECSRRHREQNAPFAAAFIDEALLEGPAREMFESAMRAVDPKISLLTIAGNRETAGESERLLVFPGDFGPIQKAVIAALTPISD